MDRRRQQVVGEFERLSHSEKIEWCNARLRRLDQLEDDLRREGPSRSSDEAMREVANARKEILKVLNRLESPPTLWQRVNQHVNAWDAEARAKEEARRERRGCVACGGSGRVVGAGNWFTTCRSCNGTGRFQAY